MIHVTRNGKKVNIKKMDTKHLLNTVCLFKRVAKTGLLVRIGGGFDVDDFYYNDEIFYGKEALKELDYNAYINEAKRRGINLKVLMRGL